MDKKLFTDYDKQHEKVSSALDEYFKERTELEKLARNVENAIHRERQKIQRQSRRIKEGATEVETKENETNG